MNHYNIYISSQPTMEPASTQDQASRYPRLYGQCQCGTVRFTTDSLPQFVSHCHCQQCRRLTTDPFISWAKFPSSDVHLVVESKDQVPIVTLRSETAVREACVKCNMDVFMKYHCSPAIMFAVTKCFKEDVLSYAPSKSEHIFVEEKMPGWEFPPEDSSVKWPRFDSAFHDELEKWRADGRPLRKDLYDASHSNAQVPASATG